MGYLDLFYEDYCANIDYWKGEQGVELPLWASNLAEKGFKGVSAVDFYNDIFGEDLEPHRLPEDYRSGEYGAIAVERVPIYEKGKPKLNKNGNQEYKGRRYIITQGNTELFDLIEKSNNFCMISPISYCGKNRVIENARYLYAMCIEVDNIEPKNGIDELVYSWERGFLPIPKPTYIVCSGTGLHIYYVFERPIPLWKNIYISLNEAKKWLTPMLWTKYISKKYQNIEFESLNQPFRCVGTVAKNGNAYAMAFQVGEKVTVGYMNNFLPINAKIRDFYSSKYTLEQAKELFPKWYQRRIVEGNKAKGHWNRYEPIYHNWIEKIMSGAVVGTRYNCLENLCSLAVQCNIEPKQVEEDCRRVAKRFEELTVSEDNHFTDYDIICAMSTYHKADEKAYRRKIDFISKKTGIELTPNKRNGRKQIPHLERARAVQNIDYPNGEWRNAEGRPNKSDLVARWRVDNPNGTKAECVRDLKIDKKTVYKWW